MYWGLTPQQQPGSYQGDEMMMKSVFLVEETGVPGENHRLGILEKPGPAWAGDSGETWTYLGWGYWRNLDLLGLGIVGKPGPAWPGDSGETWTCLGWGEWGNLDLLGLGIV